MNPKMPDRNLRIPVGNKYEMVQCLLVYMLSMGKLKTLKHTSIFHNLLFMRTNNSIRTFISGKIKNIHDNKLPFELKLLKNMTGIHYKKYYRNLKQKANATKYADLNKYETNLVEKTKSVYTLKTNNKKKNYTNKGLNKIVKNE